MRRNYLLILTFILPLKLFGQLPVSTDQYLNNTLIINPAYAGSDDALSVTLLYQNELAGFADAPKNKILSAHTPLRNDRVGFGFLLESGSYGINRETSLSGSYAYRMEVQKGTLALGLGFGATLINVAWNELKPVDPGDLLLYDKPVSALLPNFSIGAYYYNEKMFLGFSIPQLLSHEFNSTSGKYKIKNDFSEYNFFVEGGYYFLLAQDIKFLPSLLIRYNPGLTLQAEVNAQLILKERLRLGAGYRTSNKLIALLQCNITDQLMAAYSYDFDLGTVGKFYNGSHGVVLNYVFSYTRKVMSPRQF